LGALKSSSVNAAKGSRDVPIISPRMNDIHPSSTLALTAKAKDLKAKGQPVISLAAGEPDFKMPSSAETAIREAVSSGFTKYTPTSGMAELKQGVVDKVKREQGLDIDQSHVAISCGAKHALYNIFQVMCSEGDEVILPKPYWVSYPEMIKLAGAVPVYVDTHKTGFIPTPSAIRSAVSPRTKLIVLNSPSNPTGALTNEDNLKEVASILEEKKLMCVTDEIYEYYVYDGQEHVSIASLIPDFLSHVIWVNGVSKSFAMTGLRIGYTVAHSAIIKKIGILQDHSTSNPASLSQKAALAVIHASREYKMNLRIQFEEKRNKMVELLNKISGLDVFVPGGAFYIYVSVKGTGLTPEVFSNRLLEEKYVATIPGEGFGSEHYVRLSFAASMKDIEEGCRRIGEWLTGKILKTR
jgi:aspartate aminotransferase